MRDRVGVFVFVAIYSSAVFRLAAEPNGFFTLALVPLAIVTGYVLADLIAGTAHWFADRFFSPTTPLIGPLLIAPFREHHEDAASIGRHDVFEVSGNAALVCIPLALGLHALPAASSALASAGKLALASLVGSLAITNILHGWAHARKPPTSVRWLQSAGLILSPRAHALHHRGDHDRAYCVTSGWLNPMLDRHAVFPTLERWFGRRPTAPMATAMTEAVSKPDAPDRIPT